MKTIEFEEKHNENYYGNFLSNCSLVKCSIFAGMGLWFCAARIWTTEQMRPRQLLWDSGFMPYFFFFPSPPAAMGFRICAARI